MTTLTTTARKVKPSPLGSQPLATNEERVVSVRAALGLIRSAERVAFNCIVNGVGKCLVVDVTRAVALRAIRRLVGRAKAVNVADVFGTTVIG